LQHVIHCPDCGVTSVTRSRRRGLVEQLLSPVARPYRCLACGKRFFGSDIAHRLNKQLAFESVAGVLLAASLIGVLALWPLRSEVFQLLGPFPTVRNVLDEIQPVPLAFCLFLSALVACALILAGVLYSARQAALDDLGKRLRRVETIAKANGASELTGELRSELDRITEELETVKDQLATLQGEIRSVIAAEERLSSALESDLEPPDTPPALAFSEADTEIQPPIEDKPFDPIRDTHFEALDALRRGSLGDAEALLLAALRLCDERNQTGLSRGIIQYDLARVLARQGDSDAPRRRERYAYALDHLRASLAATDGEIHFKFLCDLESGGAFHQLALQPDYEPAITELMSLIQVA